MVKRDVWLEPSPSVTLHCSRITDHVSPFTHHSTRVLRGFDHVAQGGQELVRYRSVYDSMIEAKPKNSDLTNRNCIVNNHRPLLDHSDAEYRDLRLIDDRRSRPSAERSGIGDRESPALYFIRFELLLSSPLAEIVDRPSQAEQRLLISAANHRDDQSPIERDCHADVIVLLVDNLIAPHRRVDDWPLLDAFDHRFDDERH